MFEKVSGLLKYDSNFLGGSTNIPNIYDTSPDHITLCSHMHVRGNNKRGQLVECNQHHHKQAPRITITTHTPSDGGLGHVRD